MSMYQSIIGISLFSVSDIIPDNEINFLKKYLDFKELKIKANTEEFTVKNQSFI
jgi:hypothetical protein